MTLKQKLTSYQPPKAQCDLHYFVYGLNSMTSIMIAIHATRVELHH